MSVTTCGFCGDTGDDASGAFAVWGTPLTRVTRLVSAASDSATFWITSNKRLYSHWRRVSGATHALIEVSEWLMPLGLSEPGAPFQAQKNGRVGSDRQG